MIISTKKGTPQVELDRIVDNFEKQGLSVTMIRGTDYNVFGLVGDTTKIAEKDVLANPWVENVTRVSAPYKRANRLFHPDDTVVDVNGIKIGGKSPIAVMAGPCSVEGEEHTLKMAKLVKAGGANFLRGGAYKPRTSPYSFQGLGTEGILDLVKARDLLKTFDVEVNPSYATATTNRFFGSSNPAQGKFYNNRGTRLNYYAVTVLLARACLWAQKTDDALTYAQEIIDLVTAKTLKFSTSGSILSVPKMFDDLLFGFYQEKLTETFEPYVNNTNSHRLTIDDKPFFTTPTNDKRSGFIKTSTNFLTKYTVNVSDEKDKIVPNIRISEAYYIAAECLYKTDMKTAAADLMVVRKARGYSSPVLSGTMTEDAFWEALTYEYRKEFIGEGQLIFFYKRTNRPITFSEGKFDHKGKLTLPVPDSESAI